jgi:hypothetical protein
MKLWEYIGAGVNDELVNMLQEMNRNNIQMNKNTVQLSHMLTVTNNNANNPYAKMIQTTNSAKVDTRKMFKGHCGIEGSSPTCMYTGVKHKDVLCAHILPKSTAMSTLNNLCMTAADLNSPRNLLWLCSGIESAFDSMKISFVSHLFEGLLGGYVMHVWDDTCLDYPLYTDSTQTIRDVYAANRPLNLTVTRNKGVPFKHDIFKRTLANQALWCHNNHIGTFPGSLWELGDFSSLSSEDRHKLVSHEYLGSEMILTREILREIEEEEP